MTPQEIATIVKQDKEKLLKLKQKQEADLKNMIDYQIELEEIRQKGNKKMQEREEKVMQNKERQMKRIEEARKIKEKKEKILSVFDYILRFLFRH